MPKVSLAFGMIEMGGFIWIYIYMDKVDEKNMSLLENLTTKGRPYKQIQTQNWKNKGCPRPPNP